MHRQQAGAAATTPGIKLDPEQAQGIDPEANGARRKARLVIQQEALGPFGALTLGGPRRPCAHTVLIAKIFVEVDVAQLQLELAVVDKTFSANAGQWQKCKKRE
ncbi:hypothetical protein D3C78_1094590 [compost metagenome]